jgi:hypothetical protein
MVNSMLLASSRCRDGSEPVDFFALFLREDLLRTIAKHTNELKKYESIQRGRKYDEMSYYKTQRLAWVLCFPWGFNLPQ